jgi:hypothetical protein
MVPLQVVRGQAIKWGGPSDEAGKIEVPCHSRCGTIKIPSCSKVMSAEQRSKGNGDVSISKKKS